MSDAGRRALREAAQRLRVSVEELTKAILHADHRRASANATGAAEQLSAAESNVRLDRGRDTEGHGRRTIGPHISDRTVSGSGSLIPETANHQHRRRSTPSPYTALGAKDLADPKPVDRDGEVLHQGNLPASGTPLYRGVARLLPTGVVNPLYGPAVSGVARPRGHQDLPAADHIAQTGAPDSDSTSWSRNRRTAAVFTHGDGVILEWRTGEPPAGASWRFKPILDMEDYLSQVLVQGTLTGVRAVRYIEEDPQTDRLR